MNKIVIALVALVAIVSAEPPSSYGAPSFNSFSSGGGYDDGGNDGGQYVDGALLARIAQILESSDSSQGRGYSSPSSSYGAPSSSFNSPSSSYGAPSSSYGAPSRFGGGGSRFGGGGSSGISLGRPERAQRIAEFDLSSQGGQGGYSQGGYN